MDTALSLYGVLQFFYDIDDFSIFQYDGIRDCLFRELLGVCDRILVMSGGKLAGEVDAKNTTQEEIMSLAAKYV